MEVIEYYFQSCVPATLFAKLHKNSFLKRHQQHKKDNYNYNRHDNRNYIITNKIIRQFGFRDGRSLKHLFTGSCSVNFMIPEVCTAVSKAGFISSCV